MSATKNRIRQIWAEGRCVTLGWLAIPSSFTAEVMARQGFDALCVDMQHGLIGYEAMWPMLQAIGQTEVTPLVRVPDAEAATIGRVLDAGAHGVIVPMVNRAEDARRAVAATRYPPTGARSFGPTRPMLAMGPAYFNELARELLVFAMIETEEGLANLDEIAAVDGVDALYIGPADLSLALGLPPGVDVEEPRHIAACDRIREAAHRAGKRCGMHTYSAAFAARAIERGFDLVMLTSDLACMQSAAKRELAQLKAASTKVRG